MTFARFFGGDFGWPSSLSTLLFPSIEVAYFWLSSLSWLCSLSTCFLVRFKPALWGSFGLGSLYWLGLVCLLPRLTNCRFYVYGLLSALWLFPGLGLALIYSLVDLINLSPPGLFLTGVFSLLSCSFQVTNSFLVSSTWLGSCSFFSSALAGSFGVELRRPEFGCNGVYGCSESPSSGWKKRLSK